MARVRKKVQVFSVSNQGTVYPLSSLQVQGFTTMTVVTSQQ